ncbi:AmmeMemoRadiSam system protein B [Halorhodospira abdelmalekii]|uniref:AmmeMemoRadiSam system protein B n=1 Tax=Halorhodospira abdelmalekii TaxID=421629 RepID=UPI001906D892|nr:AmmeMemoRadiSam system protein B [Halorhodospira abdelmalekii]MBK1733906.1 AmmeMemoRadiSam system protein B [Halorhodospira abdelmalekii]
MQEPVPIRPPAVAGRFYPSEASELERSVTALLREGLDASPCPEKPPRAMILPHAGYPFSGSAAALGYAQVYPFRHRFRHVVLLGPAHFCDLAGLAVPTVAAFVTPLGEVTVSKALRTEALTHPDVRADDHPHAREHSIEVHLPFLQVVLSHFDVLPVAVGRSDAPSCGRLIEQFWDDETLIVVSSDLSHFHDSETAQRLDQETTTAIERLDYQRIDGEGACGAGPVRGLLWFAQQQGLQATTVTRCSSADVTGDRSSVVGYGSYVFH